MISEKTRAGPYKITERQNSSFSGLICTSFLTKNATEFLDEKWSPYKLTPYWYLSFSTEQKDSLGFVCSAPLSCRLVAHWPCYMLGKYLMSMSNHCKMNSFRSLPSELPFIYWFWSPLWVLATDEVTKLLMISPSCNSDLSTFSRSLLIPPFCSPPFSLRRLHSISLILSSFQLSFPNALHFYLQ